MAQHMDKAAAAWEASCVPQSFPKCSPPYILGELTPVARFFFQRDHLGFRIQTSGFMVEMYLNNRNSLGEKHACSREFGSDQKLKIQDDHRCCRECFNDFLPYPLRTSKVDVIVTKALATLTGHEPAFPSHQGASAHEKRPSLFEHPGGLLVCAASGAKHQVRVFWWHGEGWHRTNHLLTQRWDFPELHDRPRKRTLVKLGHSISSRQMGQWGQNGAGCRCCLHVGHKRTSRLTSAPHKRRHTPACPHKPSIKSGNLA